MRTKFLLIGVVALGAASYLTWFWVIAFRLAADTTIQVASLF